MYRTVLAVGLVLGLAATACDTADDLPDADSAEYTIVVAAFHTGLAALQVGETGVADASLQRVTELAPAEPAGWANWGLAALQRNELEEAAVRLRRARELVPEDARIRLASAIVARERGDLETAAEHLRRATLDADDPRALFLLAEILEQEGRADGLARARELVDRIIAMRPANQAALLERARLAARAGDAAALESAMDTLASRAPELPASAVERIEAVHRAAGAGDPAGVAEEIAFLQTELQELPAYRADRDALVLSQGRSELLVPRFIRLPAPPNRPAPADLELAFSADPLEVGAGGSAWVRAVWVDEFAPLTMIAAKQGSIWMGTDPAAAQTFELPGPREGAIPPAAIATLDYDYDFRVDLLVAGPGGLRLLRQADGGFTDATAGAIPASTAGRAYAGAWAVDLDMEGDVDVVMATLDGPPIVLRNLGDGRFDAAPIFEDVSRVRDFVWADLDADGDPDAGLVDDEGRMRLFLNRRHDAPRFAERSVPAGIGPVRAIAAADLTADASFDLVVLDAGGRIRLLSLRGQDWEERELAQWPGFRDEGVAATRLFVRDMDNNGRLDVVASTPAGSRIWLGTDDGLVDHAALDVRVTDVADVSGEGRPDLIAVTADGSAVWLASHSLRDYFATTIRPRAATATGDRRINSFGVGGEIEVRAGLLYQKRLIEGPVVHFGLGQHPQVDVARIIWPNGSVQAEFNLATSNEAAVTLQRLKGSCPWVFAFDGDSLGFVTDFLWRTALGLRINAQGGAAVIHSEDWILIRGDQLVARDGIYDVRITAELWETHFFDHVSLLAVDHPAGSRVFVDERFTLPAPEPAIRAMEPPRPVAGAWDHHGRDVAAVVAALDSNYLDTFELGPYQGVAEDHYMEVDLGDDVPTSGPLWLIAQGWVYPTDSSINLALGQGGQPAPRGLRLEVPDGRGGWVVAESDLGFPAGKAKTMLIDLSAVFRPGTERRIRLGTNMEIYWDRIAWAAGRPDTSVRTRRLLPSTAELRYRGFSEVEQASRTSPELPAYDRIAGTAPRWRDLVGYHTRFGDVRPLTEAVDDRYVIMNAGDELVLHFAAPPAPPDGWTRDFVLVGDGWVKDGDYNTGYSTTVLPLPYHGMADYDVAPGRLEDDPAYRRHPEDWKVFHTRFVTPRQFQHALLPPGDD